MGYGAVPQVSGHDAHEARRRRGMFSFLNFLIYWIVPSSLFSFVLVVF
jgi:hypothetical protein